MPFSTHKRYNDASEDAARFPRINGTEVPRINGTIVASLSLYACSYRNPSSKEPSSRLAQPAENASRLRAGIATRRLGHGKNRDERPMRPLSVLRIALRGPARSGRPFVGHHPALPPVLVGEATRPAVPGSPSTAARSGEASMVALPLHDYGVVVGPEERRSGARTLYYCSRQCPHAVGQLSLPGEPMLEMRCALTGMRTSRWEDSTPELCIPYYTPPPPPPPVLEGRIREASASLQSKGDPMAPRKDRDEQLEEERLASILLDRALIGHRVIELLSGEPPQGLRLALAPDVDADPARAVLGWLREAAGLDPLAGSMQAGGVTGGEE